MRISDWSSDVCSSDLFDLGVTTVTAEEIVHQFEHQLGVEDEQRSAAQRLDLYQVEAGGYIQRVHVLTEFHHLHTSDGHRSDARRVGKECVSTCRSRVSQDH